MENQKERQALSPNPEAYFADTRVRAGTPKYSRLRGFTAATPSHHWPGAWPGQPAPILREPEAIPEGSAQPPEPSTFRLGAAVTVSEAAAMVGWCPWTVRQAYPSGLPDFRLKATGRLIPYRDLFIRWTEKFQGGRQ